MHAVRSGVHVFSLAITPKDDVISWLEATSWVKGYLLLVRRVS
jgi:hypothetical protein